MNVLIAHSGGPSQVLNVSLQGILENADNYSEINKIFIASYGIEGILNERITDITHKSFKNIQSLRRVPGSVIGTCRRKISDEDYENILKILIKYEIDAFIFSGGNGSMNICHILHEMILKRDLDIKIIGIPNTVDNDIAGTDHSPGYGSAARYALCAAAELSMDLLSLPIHIIVLELMGRNTGWITAATSLTKKMSNIEQMILLPEIYLNEDHFLSKIKEHIAKNKNILITVSEGLCTPDGKPLGFSGVKDSFGHNILGGSAMELSKIIVQKLNINSRYEKPGLLGRTSMNYLSEIDILETYNMGKESINCIVNGESGYMLNIEATRTPEYKSNINKIELSKVINQEIRFPLEWVDQDNFQIKDEFSDYCLPLIGDDIPEYFFWG
ncbi:MAG: diphosphate--fructose-6-phosphate 1-phosphotransferase [Saccharofermentanales bacterium]